MGELGKALRELGQQWEMRGMHEKGLARQSRGARSSESPSTSVRSPLLPHVNALK